MREILKQKTCETCSQSFPIAAWDLQFYQKLEVPEPESCPDCREQLRTLHINQLKLFKRKCDGTGVGIISNYPADSPYKVYSQAHWHSDAVDNTEYGRDFDFSRPFFEQYQELNHVVPRPALFTDFLRDENSLYTNYAGLNKNCFLIFDSDENWDCYYSYGMNGSRNTFDSYRVDSMELCYQALDSRNCYNSAYIYNCENCQDSLFLKNCIGVKDSLFCSNLRHKQYHVFNEPVSKEEFEKLRAEYASHSRLIEGKKQFEEFTSRFPQKFMRGFQNENVSGDHLVNCKNAIHCFDSRDLWDGKYCYQVFLKAKDCMDCQEVGEGELLYECCNLGYNAFNLRFSLNCLNQLSNLTYCNYCFNGAADLFGCVGLSRKKFCILNKQYREEEYLQLKDRVIAHMKETGEWGRFFPAELSSFDYNLTIAQEIFPLSKVEAAERGYGWRSPDIKENQPATFELPDSSLDTADSVAKEVLACEQCQKNYRVIPQELAYLKQAQLPLPRRCFDCRHLERVAMRPPRMLWPRNCDNCQEGLESTFAPARPEPLFCEKCYLESIN